MVVATVTLKKVSMPSTTAIGQQLLIALDQNPADILEDVKLLELLEAFPGLGCCELEVRQLLQRQLHYCLRKIASFTAKTGSLNDMLTAVDRLELDEQLALSQKKSAHAARLQRAMQKATEFLNEVFVAGLKSTEHGKLQQRSASLCVNTAAEDILLAQATNMKVRFKLTVSDIAGGMYEQQVLEEGSSLDAGLAKTLLERQRSSSHTVVPGLHRKRNTAASEPSLDADAGPILVDQRSSSHTSVPGLHRKRNTATLQPLLDADAGPTKISL